jgi:hypothetical protein
MVASSPNSPKANLPKLDSTLLHHKSSIPPRLKAVIRTQYLLNGLSPKQIAEQGLGVSAKQISNLASSEGWARQRQSAVRALEETTNLLIDKAVVEHAQSIAAESEELAYKALDVTREGLNTGGEKGAKQAQAASNTLRNLVSVARLMRTPDAKADLGTPSVQINFFGASRSEPKPVTPSSDVVNVESRSV